MVDTNRIARGFGIAVLSLAVLFSIAALALVIGLHYALQPPDLEAEAHSAEARAARATATTAQDSILAAVVAKAPGATSLATSVEDRCVRDAGMAPLSSFVSCRRTTVRYLAFDGDRARLQNTWNHLDRDPGDLSIEWTERPTAPRVHGDFDRGMTTPVSDRQVTFAETPVDLAKLYHDAYAQHRYVITLWAETLYYPTTP